MHGGPKAGQPLREWQRIATVLAGGHFLLPLLGYYGMALFFPFLIAGMAQQAAAHAHGSQPQLHPAQTLGGAAERRGGWPAALGYGLGADALAALPVMLWRTADDWRPTTWPRFGALKHGDPADEEEEGACSAQGAGEEEQCGECEECAICCCGYSPGDAVRLLPCKHHFHQKCIDSWLRMSTRCPMCRGDLSLCPAPAPGPDGVVAATAAAPSARVARETALWLALPPEAEAAAAADRTGAAPRPAAAIAVARATPPPAAASAAPPPYFEAGAAAAAAAAGVVATCGACGGTNPAPDCCRSGGVDDGDGNATTRAMRAYLEVAAGAPFWASVCGHNYALYRQL